MGIVKTQFKIIAGLSGIVVLIAVAASSFGVRIGGGGWGPWNTGSGQGSTAVNKPENPENPELKPAYTFSFYSKSDKIFYQNEEINIAKFQSLLKDAQKRNETVQITFLIGSTTNRFQEDVKTLLENSGLAYRIETVTPKKNP